MRLGYSTWREVQGIGRERVCLIPTGSLEQHGAHLPLFTDSLLVTRIAELAEQERSERVLLFPTLWLGCSQHHRAMAGTLTASMGTYQSVLCEVVECALQDGFYKFFVLNGHGGNTEPNGVALRELKARHPHGVFAHAGYFHLIPEEAQARILEGPFKKIKHGCEAETSLMLHFYPELVRRENLRDDHLKMVPEAPAGLSYVQHFDEITEGGSLGYATLASEAKGRELARLAVEGVVRAIDHLYEGYVMTGGE